jgi:hypothetical protein
MPRMVGIYAQVVSWARRHRLKPVLLNVLPSLLFGYTTHVIPSEVEGSHATVGRTPIAGCSRQHAVELQRFFSAEAGGSTAGEEEASRRNR